MDVMTGALFLTFGGVGFKKAYLAARAVDTDAVRSQARSIKASFASRFSRGTSSAASNNDALRIGAGGIELSKIGRLPQRSTSAAANSAAALALSTQLGGVQGNSTEYLANPMNPRLAEDWAACMDGEGHAYFVNKKTGVTAWKIPAHPKRAGTASP